MSVVCECCKLVLTLFVFISITRKVFSKEETNKMAGIFKAYDIRGIYGETLTTEIVYKIGRAFATFLKCRSVVVGRDIRPHSEPIFNALVDALTLHGVDIFDIGLCSTPISYFATVTSNADAGIMITASHNPPQWNGLKLSRKGAIPIGGDSGLQDIEKIFMNNSFDTFTEKRGKVEKLDPLPAYTAHIAKACKITRPVRIAVDMANAMGIIERKALPSTINVVAMFDELDGTFPNHEANPIKPETLHALQRKICSERFDFGIAFDGDADRIGVIDEKGSIVRPDAITALIAMSLLEENTSATILYDLRSSRAVREIIEEVGGKAIKCRVGHAFIKKQMRETNAIFAGELSGHYYFQQNYFTESTALAIVCLANIVSAKGKPLSELVKNVVRYATSGEINLTIKNPTPVFDTLKKQYADGQISFLDGMTIEYPEWWFNLRASNTEPLIRLNAEANTEPLLRKKLEELLNTIRQFS